MHDQEKLGREQPHQQQSFRQMDSPSSLTASGVFHNGTWYNSQLAYVPYQPEQVPHQQRPPEQLLVAQRDRQQASLSGNQPQEHLQHANPQPYAFQPLQMGQLQQQVMLPHQVVQPQPLQLQGVPLLALPTNSSQCPRFFQSLPNHPSPCYQPMPVQRVAQSTPFQLVGAAPNGSQLVVVPLQTQQQALLERSHHVSCPAYQYQYYAPVAAVEAAAPAKASGCEEASPGQTLQVVPPCNAGLQPDVVEIDISRDSFVCITKTNEKLVVSKYKQQGSNATEHRPELQVKSDSAQEQQVPPGLSPKRIEQKDPWPGKPAGAGAGAGLEAKADSAEQFRAPRRVTRPLNQQVMHLWKIEPPQGLQVPQLPQIPQQEQPSSKPSNQHESGQLLDPKATRSDDGLYTASSRPLSFPRATSKSQVDIDRTVCPSPVPSGEGQTYSQTLLSTAGMRSGGRQLPEPSKGATRRVFPANSSTPPEELAMSASNAPNPYHPRRAEAMTTRGNGQFPAREHQQLNDSQTQPRSEFKFQPNSRKYNSDYSPRLNSRSFKSAREDQLGFPKLPSRVPLNAFLKPSTKDQKTTQQACEIERTAPRVRRAAEGCSPQKAVKQIPPKLIAQVIPNASGEEEEATKPKASENPKRLASQGSSLDAPDPGSPPMKKTIIEEKATAKTQLSPQAKTALVLDLKSITQNTAKSTLLAATKSAKPSKDPMENSSQEQLDGTDKDGTDNPSFSEPAESETRGSMAEELIEVVFLETDFPEEIADQLELGFAAEIESPLEEKISGSEEGAVSAKLIINSDEAMQPYLEVDEGSEHDGSSLAASDNAALPVDSSIPVTKRPAKPKLVKLEDLMLNTVKDEEPIQPFGMQRQAVSKKKAAKMSKLERKALRREANKDQGELQAIKRVESKAGQEKKQSAKLKPKLSCDLDDKAERSTDSDHDSDIDCPALKEISDPLLRRKLLTIIQKIVNL